MADEAFWEFAIRVAMVEGVRGYADGDEFASPMAARVVSARP
jgi:hypothetical protein